MFMTPAYEAKTLLPLSTRKKVKNTCSLHCNLAPKKNLTTFLWHPHSKLKRCCLLSECEKWKIHQRYSLERPPPLLIKIFIWEETRKMRLTETLNNDIHNHASINLLERFWLLFGLLNTHKSLTVQYEHKTKEDLIFRKDFRRCTIRINSNPVKDQNKNYKTTKSWFKNKFIKSTLPSSFHV